MRKFVFSAVLVLGVLGLFAATPSSAKAFWPNGYVNSVHVGPYGYTNVYGSQFYRWQAMGNTAWYNYYTSPMYRTTFSPYNVTQQWMSRGSVGWSYNPIFGMTYNVSTPAMAGYSYSPFYGYLQAYNVPSMSYSIPAGYVIP